MLKRFNKTAIIAVIIGVMLVSACTAAVTTTLSQGAQPLTVTRGDLNIIVSTNGNLTMPDEFGLRFGTTGKVKDILVKEGDTVKQGSILAFLDSTSQKNAIRTALYNVRTAIDGGNNIIIAASENASAEKYIIVLPDYLNTSGTCDPTYYYTFPDLSAPFIAGEAEKAIGNFVRNFNDGHYKDAGDELATAYLTLEVCEDLIKEKIDPDILAGKNKGSVYFPDTTPGTEAINDGTNKSDNSRYTNAISYIKVYRQKLLGISSLIKDGENDKVKIAGENALQEMITVNGLVQNTVNTKSMEYLTFSDIPSSLYFLQSSIRSVQELNDGSWQGDASADEISKELYLAKLNLLTGRDVLENQKLTYWWYYNWPKTQDYNLNIQTFEIALQKAIRDIKNTVIVAPSDGTVVSVGLKKDYILSAQDYSSRVAVDIVNTKKIKFTGMVDEIDILKVKKGQPATLTIDAVPDKKFTGKVKFISPYGTKVGNVVKFAVTIELDPTNVELRGMLSTSADIAVFTAGNVLLVPVSALNSGPDGYTVNVVKPDGKVETRKVTIGKQNYTYAEVLSGLNEGDKLQASTAKPNAKPNQRPPGP